jgi:L-malate glycosyltransferase
LRVAIITPFYLQATRGNAVTVRRIERYLRKVCCVTAVFSLDMLTSEALIEAVRSFSPDILHSFHAVRTGDVVAQISQDTRLPYLITITGTELYRGGETDFTEAESVLLKNAAALVVFHVVIGKRLSVKLPAEIHRLKIIPQGVEIPDINLPTSLPEVPFTFFLPAGIRPVKNINYCLKPLELLWRRYPQIRLVIAGPVLDAGYAEKVLEAVAAHPFSSWIGEIPNSAMPSLYRSAHVVLNTSFSEGGMANSILEGMAYNKPVLVSDIEGNRSLVADAVNGFLFSSEMEFIDKAERLLLDMDLRKRIAASGREYVLENCSAVKEATSYHELYNDILGKKQRGMNV